ncbi:MAG: AI-2E family transporter [Bacilli bacterium]|nr:AI-2E family transporter [Bacilli bacterium]MCI9433799.1 AI-2E family transporter [Bacilli bacterium]
MFNRKTGDKEVDIKRLNDVISMTKKILSIAYIFIVIAGIYAATLIFKEWKVGAFLINLLKIVSPLFIGIAIAWLLEPIVKFLKNHKMHRTLATSIVYILLIAIIVLIISALIPLLSEQINEIVKSIPAISNQVQTWINDIFSKIGNIDGIDISSLKSELFVRLEEIGSDLTSSLPHLTVKVVSSVFSGLGSLVIGFIIGFYLLMSFDNFNDALISFVPKKNRDDFRGLANEVNTSLRKYVQGTLICASFVFILSTIGFFIAGLKAPILFGLFCGVTNIIPYIGPYLGGAPAILVGFSQGPIVGIISAISVIVAQFLESNILNPIVMSKTMKLHPVTIIIGLLIFGHFWGMIGMLLATPTIAVLKSIILFLDDKYDILSFN